MNRRHHWNDFDELGSTYFEYAGTYAQDMEGLSDEFIDSALDGEPEAYWNID